MLKKFSEGDAEFYTDNKKVVSREMSVFYNPLMEYNRTVSIALLNCLNKKNMQIADPLAGSGIRSIRFFKELNKGIIKQIYINDHDKDSIQAIKKNLSLNKIKSRFSLFFNDANLFLLNGQGFDYIDIDPFGSPNKFLNSAVERLSREGILAVTATDTGALCGSFKDVCQRKYWATPLHDYEMHEIGLRILIRKVQLIGIQFEKALIPILSYSKDHYMRIFFRCEKGKKLCDEIVKQHGIYKKSGPMWLGKLKGEKIVNKLTLRDNFTKLLKDEIEVLGFYEIPKVCKREKIKCEKNFETIITQIKKQGFQASRTHFSGQAIKTDINYSGLLDILRK